MPDSSVEQALFGYEDGHRLLASSLRLPSSVVSTFTVMSDLAPGVRFEGSDGYWTGVPVPEIKRYALMRTWPAPEMARPGCVWTHALFVPTAALERLPDLRLLTSLIVRPAADWERATYTSSFSPDDLHQVPATLDGLGRAEEVLDALYSPGRPRTVTAVPGELDQLVFEIWSQQWPKLRRNFRFQTAVFDSSRLLGSHKFDLQFTRDPDRMPEIEPSPAGSQSSQWLATAAADLADRGRGHLRDFLRAYGAGVRRPRYSFPPLVRVYNASVNERLNGEGAYDVLELVGEAFPEPTDAKELKEALTSGEVPTLSTDLVSLLKFLLVSQHGDSYPPVRGSAFVRLKQFWPERKAELLELASIALDSRRPIAPSIVNAVLDAIPARQFWSATETLTGLQSVAVSRKPQLLVNASRLDLSDGALLGHLKAATIDASTLEALLPSLLDRDDPKLATWAASVAPEGVQSALLNRYSSGQTVPPAWADLLQSWADQFLHPVNLQRVKSLAGLFRIAEVFGFSSPTMISSDARGWLTALRGAKNDLPEDDFILLNAALLWRGIVPLGQGRTELLSAVFDPVFKKADRSYLPFKTREFLDRTLPRMRYDNYDIASRLLLAVATAFVYQDLPAAGLQTVTRDKAATKGLRRTLESFPDGRAFLKAQSGKK